MSLFYPGKSRDELPVAGFPMSYYIVMITVCYNIIFVLDVSF
jgi:hypothetical protein